MKHINLLILTIFVKHMPELIKQGKIYMALPPLYKLSSRGKNYYYYTDEELANSKIKGEVTRFKGIGEMDAQELWDTTMDPKQRKLIRLTTDNFDETVELFDTLMGKSSAARRAFINDNDLLEVAGDYFGEEEID